VPQQDCEGKEFERHYRPIGLMIDDFDKKGIDLKSSISKFRLGRANVVAPLMHMQKYITLLA
jgi:uncharacterized protein YbgA (DUF1722 family)